MEYIKNISGSLIWLFDNDLYGFKRKYIDGIDDFEPNEYMKFGIDYEELIANKNYNLYNRQYMIKEKFYGYNIIGFIDFEGFGELVEVKTKSGWRSENMIRKSRQFRIYNYYKGKNRFFIHQYNKLRKEVKISNIGWDDNTYEEEMINKINEIEKYLKQFNFKFLNKNDV